MDFTEILNMFGITMEQALKVSAVVFAVSQWVKGQWPTIFFGWRTIAVAFAVGLLMSVKLVYPNWESIAALTVAGYVFSVGAHKTLKMFLPDKQGSPNA